MNDPNLVFWVRIDLPNVEAVEDWLNIYREEQENNPEAHMSVDDFMLFLRTHDIEADVLHHSGVIDF